MNSFFSMEKITDTKFQTYRGRVKTDPYIEETGERIIKRILYLCKVRKININTLAIRAGLTPSTLKSIMYGKSKNPGIVTLRHICDGLNISLEEFFHGLLFKDR